MHKYGIAALLLCAAFSQPASAQQEVFASAKGEWCQTPDVAAQLLLASMQDRQKILTDLQQELTREQGGYLGIFMDESENPKGVKVSRVVLGSPADHAGLKNDDVIVSIDGNTGQNGGQTAVARGKNPNVGLEDAMFATPVGALGGPEGARERAREEVALERLAQGPLQLLDLRPRCDRLVGMSL